MREVYDIEVPEFPIKNEPLVCEEIDESTYVYINENDGATMTLNATASVVFDMCNGKNTDKQMADLIADTMGIEHNIILKDVQDILQELAGFGFIHD
ncbi:MAG: PqqD family protein [Ghiorsea sp.]|nr:PqqD family protein [Ghiorsea sp.]